VFRGDVRRRVSGVERGVQRPGDGHVHPCLARLHVPPADRSFRIRICERIFFGAALSGIARYQSRKAAPCRMRR
jgi:hypothetical protein